MDPAVSSRWILRLQTILKAAGLKPKEMPSEPWQDWAMRLDRADSVQPTPVGKPQPRPPVEARPRRISVSRVETLIRDPYAIYSDAVLQLKPLPNIAADSDAALRGTLFHKAMGFFTLNPRLPDAAEQSSNRQGNFPSSERSEIMGSGERRRLATGLSRTK
jgi:ATP-dependent helicase/nuclease subunit B